MLRLRGETNVIITQCRHIYAHQVTRPIYKHRGGLRTKDDLMKEAHERLNGGKEETDEEILQKLTFFGKQKQSLKELFFYSDRTGGKGYSDYASQPYHNRFYVWPPLR